MNSFSQTEMAGLVLIFFLPCFCTTHSLPAGCLLDRLQGRPQNNNVGVLRAALTAVSLEQQGRWAGVRK